MPRQWDDDCESLEGHADPQTSREARDVVLTLKRSFDSVAYSVAPNGKKHVTLSEATSEVA